MSTIAPTESFGSASPAARRGGLRFSSTFLKLELVRQARNPFTLVFTLAMPVVMYVIFGATPDYADSVIGNGNTAYMIATSMAAYGTATTMTSLTNQATAEFSRGWSRQLALTPLTTAGYAITKLLVAMAYAALSVTAVFVVAASTGARPDHPWMWFASGGIMLGLGCVFGLFGLGMGMILPSDSAAGFAPIMLTFFAFFGNVFMPLSGAMLQIAKFTPLYGFNALARWPQLEGSLDAASSDPLWALLANVAAWAVVFGLLVRFGVRRTRARQ